jgi:hypothetical protein
MRPCAGKTYVYLVVYCDAKGMADVKPWYLATHLRVHHHMFQPRGEAPSRTNFTEALRLL